MCGLPPESLHIVGVTYSRACLVAKRPLVEDPLRSVPTEPERVGLAEDQTQPQLHEDQAGDDADEDRDQ